MAKNLLAILAVFAVALLVVGLSFSSVHLEARADFVFDNGTEPQSLDPHKMKGQPEGRVADCLLEGLTRRDAETFEPVPGAAESWTVSADGRTWTFRIRENAKWSNGDPVTAHDFAWSWRRLQEPATASEYSAPFHVIRHARALNKYGAQVARLRGDPAATEAAAREGVLARWTRLVAANPEGVPFPTWTAFVAAEENDLRQTVAGTAEPALVAPLSRTAGDLTPAEAKGVGEALAREADRRAAELEVARAHFGVDQGAFAKDDRTFVVELESLAPYFLELSSFYVAYPVHRKTVEKYGLEWFREGRFVGNGPFLLKDWRVNEKIRLVKSPTYWGADEVALRVVDILPYENANTSLNLYTMGELDFIPGNYPPDIIDELRKRPDYKSCPGMVVYFYRLNVTREPFNDVRVRKALAKAVDRVTIVQEIARKGETPATTLVPTGVPGYESPPNDLAFDPAAARKLLAEAGYGPGGKKARRFTIVHNTHEGHKKIAEFLASEWQKHLGLEVQVNNKEWQALLADVQKLEYDIERAGWIGDYRDPKTFLDMWITGDGNNETGWSDPVFDRFIAKASEADRYATAPEAEIQELLSVCREKDRMKGLLDRLRGSKGDVGDEERLAAALAVRAQLFREAESRLLNDGIPIIPFYFYVVSGLVKPDVQGLYFTRVREGKTIYNLQDDHPLRNVRTARTGTASK
jgi:oligopeptide transport system substrate-binding protein